VGQVTSPNERALIPVLLPFAALGIRSRMSVSSASTESLLWALVPCLASFAVDFVSRQKLGRTSLTPFTVKQLQSGRWRRSRRLHRGAVVNVSSIGSDRACWSSPSRPGTLPPSPATWAGQEQLLARAFTSVVSTPLHGASQGLR